MAPSSRFPIVKILPLFLFFSLQSVHVLASTWVWDGGDNRDRWGNGYEDNWDKNTNPQTESGITPTVIFNDSSIGGNVTVQLRDSHKTVHSVLFSGEHSYTLTPKWGKRVILDNGSGAGTSIIGTEVSTSGNAKHTVNVKVDALNDFTIQHRIDKRLDFKQQIDIASHNLTIDSDATNDYVRIKKLKGSGTVTKIGAGNVYLSGNNTSFTGDVVVEAGNFIVNKNKSLGSGSSQVTVESGGSLTLRKTGAFVSKDLHLSGAGSANAAALQAIGGNSSWTGDIILEGDASIGADSSSQLTINGSISGAHNLTFGGAGDISLKGSSSHTGTTSVVSGMLVLDNDGGEALAHTSNIIIQSGGTVFLNRDNQISDTADISLDGGILRINRRNEALATMTFSGDSRIELDGTEADLDLTDLVRTDGVLTIDGYARAGQINVTYGAVDSDTLASIYFEDQGIMGATQLLSGDIVPTPEPSTWLLGCFLALAIPADIYRRFRGGR